MLFFTFIINFFLFLSVSNWTNAIFDPTLVPNNPVGIHILFSDEIEKAAKIVNNDNRGAWGYVTVPIEARDRNRDKWQTFFDKCTELKVIPIIRVATVPDGSNWTEPNNYDLIDFANFLGDLKWPIANRYVVIFNEVNRSDEYGGYVKPENYADILVNASDIFKNVSSDFFILPAGLDNAAPNSKGFMNSRLYIERMYLHRPDIFEKIDGWTSHAYPNPDFSSRPDKSGTNKIDSFKYDLRLIRQFTTKKLPVFITETGWSGKYLSDNQQSYYYKYAMEKVWSDNNIISITPFLLSASDGPFVWFSFVDKESGFKEFVGTFSSYAKLGSPIFPNAPTTSPEIQTANSSDITSTTSASVPANTAPQLLSDLLKNILSLFGFIHLFD